MADKTLKSLSFLHCDKFDTIPGNIFETTDQAKKKPITTTQMLKST